MTLHYTSRFLFVFLFSLLANTTSFSQIITTVAGNGTNSSCGDGGPATSACLPYAIEVAVDAAGNLYVSGALAIRKVNSSGIITTIAGSTAGTGGDGGPAVNAQFTNIRAMAFDATGNLYICDGHRIRKINTTGIITTIAGSITSGFAGDNGPATLALFNNVADIDVDAAGNIFIADSDNNRIRKINTAGIITTVAGNGTAGFSDGVATASMLFTPRGVAVDAAGNIYIGDSHNHRIRKVNTSGMLSTIGGDGTPWMQGLTGGIGGDGGLAINAHATNSGPIAIDAGGSVYFSAGQNIRVIRPNNKIYTFAGAYNMVPAFTGDGGLAVFASLGGPKGMAFDAANNMYIADGQNYRVRKVSMCTTIPAQPPAITGSASPCPMSTYTYSVPQGTNMSYYDWTIPASWTVTNYTASLNSITVTTSNYGGTVSVTSNNLCGASPAQVLATPINDTPITQIYPIADYYTICPGQLFSLSTNTGLGYNYYWYNDGSFTIPFSTNPTTQVNGNAYHYCLKIVDADGCIGRDCVEQQQPMVMIDDPVSPQTICQGDSVMMVAVTNTDTMYNIQWKKNGVNVPGATNDTFYAKQTGSYTIAAVNNQCDLFFSGASIVNLSVVDTPTFTVTPSGPLTFCSGGSVTFNISNLTYGNLTWYKDGNLLPWFYPYTINSSGLYTLVAGNTCTTTKYFTVVSDTVLATASWPGTASVCYGETVLLTANTGTGYTYQWKVNNVDIPGAVMPTYTATSSGAYTVTIDDGLCSDLSNYVNVVVSTMHADLTAGGPTTFCDGGNVLLTANTGQWYMYQWLQDGNNLGNTANTYTADQSGLYSVIISYGDCLDTAQVSVTETPFPVVAIAQNGTELSVPGGYTSYQWYLNGAAISGANSEIYNAIQDGDYYVVVSNGCEGQSNTINLFLAVNDFTPNNTILIHPNPFRDHAVLTFSNAQHKPHSFKLYDVQGQLVREAGNITGSELKIERGVLPAGMYYYRLYKEQSIVGSGKLIVE